MNIKRYFAPDTRRAINLVRAEHGPDAVILSSKTVEGGVEIVAAVDYDQGLMSLLSGSGHQDASETSGNEADGSEPRVESAELSAVPAQYSVLTASPGSSQSTSDGAEDSSNEREDAAATEDGPAEGGRPLPDPDRMQRAETAAPEGVTGAAAVAKTDKVIGIESTQELKAIQRDLYALKGMVRERIAWADMRGHTPQRAWLMRKAEAFGLTPALADTLVNEVEHLENDDRAWREVIFGMARRILVMRDDPLERGGIVALVGPTGVGKTTTIAKLAARQCMRGGADSLALITTDSNRIGAHRQLEAFGAILGVPVRRADTPEELTARLKELSSRHLILIDTAGAAPRDAAIAKLLQRLDKRFQIMQFLVLAANMQASVMREAVTGFGGRQLDGAVLTKLDEASGLGAALSVLIEVNLPAVWISEGQRVPDDLRLARVANLLKRAAVLNEMDQQPAVPAFVSAGVPAEQQGEVHAAAH